MADPSSPDSDDGLAALDFFAPQAESTASDLDSLGEYGIPGSELVDLEDDAPRELVFTVTNPPGTVTVATSIDGRVHHVELSQQVTSMTEEDLAEEIVVIARLATQDARAAQYEVMLEGMREYGHDDVTTRDFLTRDLALPSPAEAVAARAQVFATRYAGEE